MRPSAPLPAQLSKTTVCQCRRASWLRAVGMALAAPSIAALTFSVNGLAHSIGVKCHEFCTLGEAGEMTKDQVQRRLAAILAADAVGYSRLMDADEEATLRTLRAHRSTIERSISNHGGRVFGSAGDSVIAEFPSPVKAVRCAIDIQQSLETGNAGIPEDLSLIHI